MKTHYTEKYLINPEHPVTVQVIGAGGNGSQVLTQLARMDKALKGLGHTGLHVTLFDGDQISESNLGRQLFSQADVGQNKASVLITRYNRFFGTSWKAVPQNFDKGIKLIDRSANITITCVDSISVRKEIKKLLSEIPCKNEHPYSNAYYWMDLGNTQNTGQFVIGTLRNIFQRSSCTNHPDAVDEESVSTLPDVFKKFPEFEKQKDKDTGPSCSLAEALERQDLFINSMLSQYAIHTLWRMFRETKINYHGAFINLDTLKIAPIYF